MTLIILPVYTDRSGSLLFTQHNVDFLMLGMIELNGKNVPFYILAPDKVPVSTKKY